MVLLGSTRPVRDQRPDLESQVPYRHLPWNVENQRDGLERVTLVPIPAKHRGAFARRGRRIVRVMTLHGSGRCLRNMRVVAGKLDECGVPHMGAMIVVADERNRMVGSKPRKLADLRNDKSRCP